MTHSPGTLLHSEAVPTNLGNAQAWRIRYTTADVNGKHHEATGLVIAPTSASTNRPVLTWCHGTTGLGDASCPSAQPDPVRELTTYFTAESTRQIDYGVPGLQNMIDNGWVVCATDYQGLGTPGMHQYTVNVTNAKDAVYIVHAARALDLDMGNRFGCMGWSQGGGAAAAVAELSADIYGDLTLVGTVPMSPGVGKIALSDPTGVTAALSDSSAPPDSHLVMVLAGHASAFPGELKMSDVFTPLGEGIVNTASNTQPVHHLNDTIARIFRLNGAVLQNPIVNMDLWIQKIDHGSAAQMKPVAPVLVCMDTFDGGTVVPVAWQNTYVQAVKQLGGDIAVKEYPNDDHFSLPASCVDDALTWLSERLAG